MAIGGQKQIDPNFHYMFSDFKVSIANRCSILSGPRQIPAPAHTKTMSTMRLFFRFRCLFRFVCLCYFFDPQGGEIQHLCFYGYV